MATKTLGLTGRDYSTLAAWASYVNALSLSANEILEVYNDGGAVADTTSVVVGGWTANGFSVTMRPASGQGIKDNANKLTNALRWNASNGAALTTSIGYTYGYDFAGANLVIQDLQFRASASSSSATARVYNSATLSRCVLWKNTGGYVLIQGASGFTINDSLLVNGNGNGIQALATGLVVNNCTIATITAGGKGVAQPYAVGPVAKNCVFWNFTTDTEGTAGGTSTNNATSKASFSGSGWGTSGQTSVTSSDFENVSSGTEDFRIKSGSTKLIDTGAASVGSGSDVVGTTRTGTRDIGAWEFTSSGTDATGTGSIAAVTLTAPTGTASGAGNATGTGSIAAVTLTAPTGSASTSGAGNATGDIAAVTLTAPTGSATGGTSGAGTVSLGPLKNNTGTVLASETGITVHVYATTGALVVTKTGQTSNGSGVCTVVDAAMSPSTAYRCVIVLGSGAEGMVTVTAA